MPDTMLIHLCSQIAAEKDPFKLNNLIDQLIELLRTEQDTIKANIKARLVGHGNLPY